jgi:hypothetical protein
VAEGYDGRDEIVERIREVYGEELEEGVLAGLAARATDEAIAAHLAEQEGWGIPTDCDRLDRAFAALEKSGIVARQHFTCCQTCGHGEIWDEIGGRQVEGYTFFHWQDTESAVEGHGLHLAFGAMDDAPEAARAVGEKIVQALRSEGLEVEWDGSIGLRILVKLTWRRRRARS